MQIDKYYVLKWKERSASITFNLDYRNPTPKG